MEIRKNDTDYLKGIGILLMFAHHLFAFPERILPPSVFIPLFSSFDLEIRAGLFGKICVPIFLFLSGYGFAVIGKRPLKYYADKVLRFFQIYWFYFLIFIPIGIVYFGNVTFFNSSTPRYTRDIHLLFLNFFALTFSFNGEWWFIQPYLLLVILFPLIRVLAEKPVLCIALSIVLFKTGDVLFSRGWDTNYISTVWLLLWQLPFIMGTLMGRYKIRISAILAFAEKRSRIATTLLAAAAVPVLWHFLELPGLMCATPFFLYCCLQIRKLTGERTAVISFLGSISFPMWLTHSFFCYYYWPVFTYWPGYSILVFINLTAITALSCWILEKARVKLFAFPAAARALIAEQ